MNAISKAGVYLGRFAQREFSYYRMRPTNMLAFLTYRCTSRCRSCTMWQRPVTDGELSLEEWKSYIDRMAAQGIRNVEMFGGDALLRKDVLFPLARHMKDRGIPQVDVVTNGNLVDAETARELVSSGFDVIMVSMDGVGQRHDLIRGRAGSFNRAQESVELLLAARGKCPSPRIMLNCTVSALNLDSFEQVYDYGLEAGVDKVAFEYVGEFPSRAIEASAVESITPRPYFIPQEQSLLLSRPQAVLLKHKIREVRARSAKAGLRLTTVNIDTLGIDQLVNGIFPNRRCYVCRYQVTVDPFGNLLPCPFFPDYHLGSIRRESFEQIWNNRMHRAFAQRTAKAALPLCRHCILGVERNATFTQSVGKMYLQYRKAGYDEQ